MTLLDSQLVFDPATHRYSLDGVRLPGVTGARACRPGRLRLPRRPPRGLSRARRAPCMRPRSATTTTTSPRRACRRRSSATSRPGVRSGEITALCHG